MKQEKLINKLSDLEYSNDVSFAIASERIYQEEMWNSKTTTSGGVHNDTEFLVFVRSYLNKAIDTVSTQSEPTASLEASHIIRKIGAMIIASSEINEWENYLYGEIEKHKTDKFKDLNVTEFLALMHDNVNAAFQSIPYSKLYKGKHLKGLEKMAGILFLCLECMKYNHSFCRDGVDF